MVPAPPEHDWAIAVLEFASKVMKERGDIKIATVFYICWRSHIV